MAKENRKFDKNFKMIAVKLTYETNNIKELARKLGINPISIYTWRLEYNKFGENSFQRSGRVRVNPEKEKIFQLEKKLKDAELSFEILKNGSKHLFEEKYSILEFIKKNEKRYKINKMCKILEIGTRRYRVWKTNGISEKQKQIAQIKFDIIKIFFDSKRHYGASKITAELQKKGFKVSIFSVSNYMRNLGLRRIVQRKFVVTTDSKHNNYTAPNVLNRNFKTNAPSKVWVSDITYLQTKKGFLYLTVIMDLYDRKIIGWNLSIGLSTIKTSLAAWEMAVCNREVLDGLIFHSDRGVQYANRLFTNRLQAFDCIQSMSHREGHVDNAVCESFFNTLKRELIYRNNKILTRKEMRAEIFNYIENWYNIKRIHSTLNYKTIEEFNAMI